MPVMTILIIFTEIYFVVIFVLCGLYWCSTVHSFFSLVLFPGLVALHLLLPLCEVAVFSEPASLPSRLTCPSVWDKRCETFLLSPRRNKTPHLVFFLCLSPNIRSLFRLILLCYVAQRLLGNKNTAAMSRCTLYQSVAFINLETGYKKSFSMVDKGILLNTCFVI